jgi:hypothetical protein
MIFELGHETEVLVLISKSAPKAAGWDGDGGKEMSPFPCTQWVQQNFTLTQDSGVSNAFTYFTYPSQQSWKVLGVHNLCSLLFDLQKELWFWGLTNLGNPPVLPLILLGTFGPLSFLS